MTYGEALATDERVEGEFPVISSGGVTGSHSRPNTRGPVIVVGRKGSHGSVWWSDRSAFVIDTAYSIDNSNTAVHLRWLYYLLRSLSLDRLSHDVGVPGLSREIAYEAEAPVSSLAEQRRIADFLDDRVARIDQIITARRQQQVLLHECDRAQLNELVVSAGGMKRPLQVVTDPRRPIQYGIILPGPDFEGGVPIIKGGDIGSGRLTRLELKRTDPAIERAYARSRVHPGDLVIAIRGSVGEVDVVPPGLTVANLTQDSARIAPFECDSAWLRATLESPRVQARMSARTVGSTVKGINIEDLRKLPISVPSFEAQCIIGAERDAMRISTDEHRSGLRRAIVLLQEYKQSLITAAVTGEFDVTTASASLP